MTPFKLVNDDTVVGVIANDHASRVLAIVIRARDGKVVVMPIEELAKVQMSEADNEPWLIRSIR